MIPLLPQRIFRCGLGALLLVGLGYACESVSGPVPEITSVAVVSGGGGTTSWEGIATGWNGEPTTVLITGANLAPLPRDVASAEYPGLELPRVWLETSPPVELENVLWLDSSRIFATVPAGIDPGGSFAVYGIRVVNPSGEEVIRENAFEVSVTPPPVLGPEGRILLGGGGIFPTAVNRTSDAEVLIGGEGLVETPTVYLIVEEEVITVEEVVSLSSGAVSVTIQAPDLDPETYDVVLVNPDGQYDVLPGAFSVVNETAPDPISLYPEAGYEGDTTPVRILGEDFSSGTRVFFGITPDGYPYPITGIEAGIFFLGTDRIDVRIPAGLSPGVYDLVLVDANGLVGVVPDAYEADITVRPVIFSISPTGVCGSGGFSIFVNGAYFQPGAEVWLASGLVMEESQLTLFSDSEHISGMFLELDEGIYDVIVENPDGEIAVLPGAFQVSTADCPFIISAYPPFGWTNTDTFITVSGMGFESTPEIILAQGTAAETVLRNVAFINENSLAAVIPTGVPAGGPYSLTVINPSGGLGTTSGLFTVTQHAPPIIDGINPGSAMNDTDVTITITGSNFLVPEAPIETVTLLGLLVDIDCPVISIISDTQMTAECNTLNVEGSAPEGQYILQVVNAEDAYGVFHSFVLTNPSGKLNPPWTVVSSLVTARLDFGAAVAGDNVGNTYIYAAGGRTGIPGFTVGGIDILDSVEVAQVDPFGNLSAFRSVPNSLQNPRAGLELVMVPGEDKNYLYAVGGFNDTAHLDTLERTVILEPGEAPNITDISFESGGNLAAGTWYYRVAAVKGSGDSDNPGGETLASEEWTIRVDEGSEVVVSWVDPDPANTNAYRVYRTDSANGTSFTEHRIAEVTAAAFTDTGLPAGTVSPLPAGSCGVWQTVSPGLSTPRSGHSALVGTDPDGDRYLYVLGGTANGTTGLDTFEFIALTSGGLISGAAFEVGAERLMNPRFNHDGVEASHVVAPIVSAGTSYIYLFGGESDGVEIGNLEMATILSGGETGAWDFPPETGTPPFGSKGSDVPNGEQVILTNAWFYIVGGSPTIASPQNLVEQAELSNLDGTVSQWTSAGAPLTIGRYLHESVISGAYFFTLGGWNGTGPERTVERVLW